MIIQMKRGREILARAAVGATLLCITLLAAGCVKPVVRDDDGAPMATSPEQVRRAPTAPAVRPQEATVQKKRKASATAKQPVEDPAAANPPVETSLEPAAAPPPAYVASELMGKKPAEVTALMGAPQKVEQRAASTVWVYQDGNCGLDVFFFLDVATSDERVLTIAPTAESEAAAANAAETPPPTTAQAASDATQPAPTPTPADSVVDVCYGKLRRS